MVKVDTIEGTVDGVLWCHYDVLNDVLYLRLVAERETPTIAEESDDGSLLLRRSDDAKLVGMTVVSWWKRFGRGKLPDSIRALEEAIEPWAKKLAA
ncbi:MAG: hypothetical protein AABZ12_07900 [Planctomycetota bacterium]